MHGSDSVFQRLRAGKHQVTLGYRLSIAMVLCLFVAACTGQPLVPDRQVARDRVEAYIAAHPETGKETARSKRRFELHNGMTRQEGRRDLGHAC